jgi:hypothetical protein
MGSWTVPAPEWDDALDVVPPMDGGSLEVRKLNDPTAHGEEISQMLADCFLQVSRLGYGAFYLLSRYESALWRQAAQLLFLLQSRPRMTRRQSPLATPEISQPAAARSHQK